MTRGTYCRPCGVCGRTSSVRSTEALGDLVGFGGAQAGCDDHFPRACVLHGLRRREQPPRRVTRSCVETNRSLQWIRPYGATSVARQGSSFGEYAPWGSNGSGPGRPTPYEPGEGNPRFASPDVRASCWFISSVVKARHTSKSAGPPKPSRPFDVPGSVCKNDPASHPQYVGAVHPASARRRHRAVDRRGR